MHKNTDFIIYSEIIKFNKYLRKYVINNIPSVHRDLKIHLADEGYNIVKCLVQAEYNRGNIRNKYLTDLLIAITMCDYLLNNIYDEDIVSKKYVTNAIGSLTNIKNMVFAWKKNIDSSVKQ